MTAMSPGRCSLVTGQPECIDYCYTLQRYAGAFEVGFSHMSTSNCITFIIFSRHRFTANDRHSQSIAVSLLLERLLQSTSLAQARTLPFHVVCIMQRKWKHYKLVKRLISLVVVPGYISCFWCKPFDRLALGNVLHTSLVFFRPHRAAHVANLHYNFWKFTNFTVTWHLFHILFLAFL